MPNVVLITGASSGLGKALAQHLHELGYRVYGTSRNGYAPGTPFPMLALDVADQAAISRAVQTVIDQEGRIDVLVNNAGVGMGAPLELVEPDSVRKLFETNVFGLLRVCQAVLPHQRAAGGGKIINISSIGGTVGLPFRGIYCASKAAVDMLTETFRMEVRGFGVQVCAILAGDMQTPIKSNWVGSYRGDDPVYGPKYQAAIATAGQQVDQGLPPLEVARQVEQIIRTPSLRKTYVIGKPIQRLSLLAKRLLPASWFEQIILQYANLK